MHADTASDPKLLAQYEGLVRTTASMTIEAGCEDEFEDICQRFRIKVWKALLSFHTNKLTSGQPDAKGRTPRDRYVFSCIKNEQKDLLKKPRRAHRTSYIEDMTERFEAGFLGVSDETVFAAAEEIAPLIPSTLDARERRIVTLLYLDFDYGEIGDQLGIKRKQVATIIRGIRVKLADWAPPGWSAPTRTAPIAAEPLAVAA